MKRHVFRAFSIGLTVACLVAGVYTVDLGRTLEAIGRADRLLMALAAFLLLLTFGLFALRWYQLILVQTRLPRRRVFNFMMIGYMANAVLPARPGDLIRALLLRQSQKISLSFGLASIVLERLFDLVAICVLGVAASFIVPLPAAVDKALYGVASACGGLIVTLLLFSFNRTLIERFRLRFPQLFRIWIARFLIEFLDRFASAIGVLHSPSRLLIAIALTCIGWAAFSASVMVLVVAFHLPAPAAAGLIVVVTTNLGAAIPSLPGSLGIYHFMAVLALSPWQVETSLAIAFAIGTHAIAIGQHVLLGLGAAWLEGVGLMGLSRAAHSVQLSEAVSENDLVSSNAN